MLSACFRHKLAPGKEVLERLGLFRGLDEHCCKTCWESQRAFDAVDFTLSNPIHRLIIKPASESAKKIRTFSRLSPVVKVLYVTDRGTRLLSVP
jgi:hypothetical protein